MMYAQPLSMSLLSMLVLSANVLAGVSEAEAQDKVGAKKHFEAGLELMQSEEFAAAAVEFEESLRLYETKSAMLNLSSCHKALRRFDEALATLSRLELRFAGALDPEMRQAVDELREGILSSTGTLEVKVNQPDAEVLIDGVRAGASPLAHPVRLAPGEHRLEVTSKGMAPHVETVRLLSGQALRRAVSLVPAPESPRSEGPPAAAHQPIVAPEPASEPDKDRAKPLLIASLASTGLTAVLGVVAGVLWGAAANQADAYEASRKSYLGLEPQSLSAPAEREAWNSLEKEREDAESKNAAAVGLTIGAGAMVAVSAALWIAWGRTGSNEQAPVAISAAPGGLAIAF
jgi:hypothetical protein